MFHYRLAADDVLISLETSTDLTGWGAVEDAQHLVSENLGDGFALREIRLPRTRESDRRFVRLRVGLRPTPEEFATEGEGRDD